MKRSVVMAAITSLRADRLAAQTTASATAKTAAAANGPAPRMPDGHPDLSGVWWRGADIGGKGFVLSGGGGRGDARPPSFTDLYQPGAAAKAGVK